MWRRTAGTCLVALAALTAAATPTAADDAPASVAADARVVVGEPQGLSSANEQRPVRVAVRAVGADLVRVRVVLLDDDGKFLGRSGRFALDEGERKVARVRVGGDLPEGERFTVRASGRTR
jgi:hypothetical protein